MAPHSGGSPGNLRHVLDALLDGVLVVDTEAVVRQVNLEASRILESSSEALVGRPIDRVLGESHALAKLAREVMRSGRAALESDQRVERRFAPPCVVEVAASPLFDGDGLCEGAVLTLHDRTVQSELRELEADRERLASFGRIAAGIAHEVKNPLGGIRGAAELLARRAGDGRTHDTAGLIVREVDRITRLVDDLMEFARGDKLVLAPMNLHRVLDEVLELLDHDPLSHDRTVSRIFDPSIPELLADRSRLTQVFLNLARNALQAMEAQADGSLRITTRMRFDHKLPRSAAGRSGVVSVELADTGPGIPQELIEKVGTPLFTTRVGGTGLGLPLAGHYVGQHGGTLRIESERGRGTRVEVALPLRRVA